MKKLGLAVIIGSLCLGGSALYAQTSPTSTETTTTTTTTSSTESELNGDASTIDQESKTKGSQVVTQKIMDRFDVTEEQVADLRKKKMGYGEISILYSLASKMEGGATEENVQKLLEMRQSHMGWGKIAQKVDLKLGPVLTDVRKTKQDITTSTTTSDSTSALDQTVANSQKGSKKDRTSVTEKNSHGDKPERSGKTDRIDRPEKIERGHSEHTRVERPEHVEHGRGK
jgi:hypothetical protein